MSMSSCWLITWFILCSGGFVYHFASGPCFFDVCARFNQLLLKHWWKLCQACEGRLLYLENNSRWGTAGFSELGCFYLFIYFGCLKDASKAPRNGLTFLSFCILNPHLSDCHIFPAKENYARVQSVVLCCFRWKRTTCFSWDDLVPGLRCWYPDSVWARARFWADSSPCWILSCLLW